MAKVLISTVPFSQTNSLPLELLNSSNIDVDFNPLGRKLTESDLIKIIQPYDALIAGTEMITASVMNAAPNLQLISRVGVGLDGVDLSYAKKRGIKVSYTPNAPSPAVAELTIGLIINLMRSIHIANERMHLGQWKRDFGGRIGSSTIGLIGMGRIGKLVLGLLSGFHPKRILINDLNVCSDLLNTSEKISFASKDEIFRNADVISLHVPLTSLTKNMISGAELRAMKNNTILINTSRGGVINESDLDEALKNNIIAGAAIDVFENEPYSGSLCLNGKCLLTSHMGSMSYDCREAMELEATKEVVKFFKGESLDNLVPLEEYLANMKA